LEKGRYTLYIESIEKRAIKKNLSNLAERGSSPQVETIRGDPFGASDDNTPKVAVKNLQRVEMGVFFDLALFFYTSIHMREHPSGVSLF